ncbi:hypothetical protein [Wolbachia endosymbiont (group B) of Hofmannophila pseudospretella]|uniref:hypothetical protein n=1 Tax=Wolbachia endosymbiont (group B) of Hofmannophila pseudospretella TaxID=3066177 RepID=UPI00334155CE
MESSLDHNYNKILDILKCAIDDNQVKARKHLRVERWLRVYIQLIEDFNEEELKFFSDIFSDNSCWNGIKLNNKVVGERLIAERSNNGQENPLDLSDRYYLACKYCLEDKIPGLFEQVFERFKRSAFREVRSDDVLKEKLLNHIKETSPIKAFWSFLIDKQTGKLNEYQSVEGLQKSTQINSSKNWEEGIEFFYNKLQNDPGISSQDKDNMLIEAALSGVRGYKEVDTIEFCLSKTDSKQKEKLLERDYKENTYYAVLSALRDQYCFDSFMELSLLCNQFTRENYATFLSSLSDKVLKNPDLSEEIKKCMMNVWERIIKFGTQGHRRQSTFSIFEDYSVTCAIANLIVDPSRQKEGALEKILKHVNNKEMSDEEIKKVKSLVLRKIQLFHGGKKLQLGEQVFSKLAEEASKELSLGVGDILPQSEISLATDALQNIKFSSHSK